MALTKKLDALLDWAGGLDALVWYMNSLRRVSALKTGHITPDVLGVEAGSSLHGIID